MGSVVELGLADPKKVLMCHDCGHEWGDFTTVGAKIVCPSCKGAKGAYKTFLTKDCDVDACQLCGGQPHVLQRTKNAALMVATCCLCGAGKLIYLEGYVRG